MKTFLIFLFPFACLYMFLVSILVILVYPIVKIKHYSASLQETMQGMVRTTTNIFLGRYFAITAKY